MQATGATECQVVRGTVRVLAHEVDDLEYLSATLRDGMEEGMNIAEVWQEWVGVLLPSVKFVCYLGDAFTQVYPPILKEQQSKKGIGVLGAVIPVAFALLLLAMIVARNRRAVMTSSQFHMMNSDFVLSGTGDPPDAFHSGLYHYLRDGTRYLSTQCEACLETRKNSFYTDHNLATIFSGEEYEEEILVAANSKDLGAKVVTQDVHKCASAICDRCRPPPGGRNTGTTFVPSDKRMHAITEHVEV